MGSILDLLRGLPRIALSPSHLLAGEVTMPYGHDPSPEAVESAWRASAGDHPCPPWILLGPSDTPNGTVWKLAWCPPRGAAARPHEIVLPQAVWALDLLSAASGPQGPHHRIAISPDGVWVGLWDGTDCKRLHGPLASEQEGIERLRAAAASEGIEPGGEIRVPWSHPAHRALRNLAATRPESDLLDTSESVKRVGERADRTALARVVAVVAIFAAITAGLASVQALAWHRRASQESRLAAVRPLLERSARLRQGDVRLLDTLRGMQDALRPNSSADRILVGLSRKIPPSASLQVLTLEGEDEGWHLRAEAHMDAWDMVEPFARSLRAAPGVKNAVIASQTRSDDGVSAVVELKGIWP
jgi:hypothetical protein